MKRVAIVGIQGVPAKYGGFETLVENIIGNNSSPQIHYTVFCSAKDYSIRVKSYKGVSLKYVPLFHANGAQSTPYDILSMMKCIRGYDAVLVLGVSGCIFLPLFRLLYRNRLIVNIDGLEHRRTKWGKLAKWFLRTSEAMAVRFADVTIADNKGIQDYVWQTYHKKATLIAYGGDHVEREVSPNKIQDILNRYGVHPNQYAISVCRIEPENNSHLICEAFASSGKQLIFIGNWNRSDYSRTLKAKYDKFDNIHLVDSVYDLDELYALRSQCRWYIHGHSAGGTNPSLVEAMFFAKPILAFDVVYNRETTENQAYYFQTVEQLKDLLTLPVTTGYVMKEIALRRYTWKHIAARYEALYGDMI